MANENRYYKTPFAESGNKTEIPDVSVGGVVGYDSGYGPDYELPQGSVNRKRIDRDMFNGMNYGVTKNLKQWQENLYPTWIEDDGTGSAFAYSEGMIVSHSSVNYISLEDSNQEEPGTGDKWSVKSSTIKDLSIPYVFDTVDAMKASSIEFPEGKLLLTKVNNLVSNDGGAAYIVKSGSSPETVGSPDLQGSFYADLQGKSGWMSPEVFGSDGTAAVDSVVIPKYLKECKKQLWKSGKTYLLDADIAGGANSFEVFSDTEMNGYGAIIDMRGAVNNGFVLTSDNGALFRNKIRGFRFIQSDVDAIASAILISGFVNYMTIEDCVCIGTDQYFIGMGGDDSGYDHLTIVNNVAKNINPQLDNEFSLCYELFPKQPSYNLYFHDNYGEQVGNGGVFKIHGTENNYIHDNTFVRTSNTIASQSQAVMLGGRTTHPTDSTYFHDNKIVDASSALGALFIGNTSTKTFVEDNEILGAGGILWVGNSISDSKIKGNTVSIGVFSLSPSQNDIENLTIDGNEIPQINFLAPSGGNMPDNIDGLKIKNNEILTGVRIDASTSSVDVTVSKNEFIDINSTCLFYADDVTFERNTVSISGVWSSGTQVITATGSDYKQSLNTWNLKGLAAQTSWLNGTVDAQVVGETIQDAITRVALDNGTNSTLFDNRLKLASGSWSVV